MFKSPHDILKTDHHLCRTQPLELLVGKNGYPFQDYTPPFLDHESREYTVAPEVEHFSLLVKVMGGGDDFFDYGILQQVTIMAAIFSLIGLAKSLLITGAEENLKSGSFLLNKSELFERALRARLAVMQPKGRSCEPVPEILQSTNDFIVILEPSSDLQILESDPMNSTAQLGPPVNVVDTRQQGAPPPHEVTPSDKRQEWRIGDIVTLNLLGSYRTVRFINKRGNMQDEQTGNDLKLPTGEPHPPPPFDPSAPRISTNKKQFISRPLEIKSSPAAMTPVDGRQTVQADADDGEPLASYESPPIRNNLQPSIDPPMEPTHVRFAQPSDSSLPPTGRKRSRRQTTDEATIEAPLPKRQRKSSRNLHTDACQRKPPIGSATATRETGHPRKEGTTRARRGR